MNIPRSIQLARGEWDRAVLTLQTLHSIGLHTRLHDVARTIHNLRGLIGVLRDLDGNLPLVMWIQGTLEETCSKYPEGIPLSVVGQVPVLHSLSEAIAALIDRIGVPPLDPKAPLELPPSSHFPAAPSVVAMPPATRRFVLPRAELPRVKKVRTPPAQAGPTSALADQPDQPHPGLIREVDIDAQNAFDELHADGEVSPDAAFHRLKGALNTAGLYRAGVALHTIESAVRILQEKQPEQVLTFSREAVRRIVAITNAAVDDQMNDYARLVAELRADALMIVGDSELPPAPSPPPASAADTPVSAPSMRQGIELSVEAVDEIIAQLMRIEDEASTTRSINKGRAGEDDEATAQLSSLRNVERAFRAKDADGSFMFPSPEESHRPGFALLDLTRETPVNRLLVPMLEAIDSLSDWKRGRVERQFATGQSIDRMDRLIRTLRERMLNLRLVEFSTLADACERTLKRRAQFEHKPTRLVIVGGGTKIDRRLLQALRNALIAMIGNAIGHGIEKERPAHKPAEGTVTISASANEPGKVQIEVRDDGAGIDFGAIERRANEMGRPAPPNGWTDESLLQLLFSPGFSTRSHADETAGRGQGTNIVARTVESLGGILRVESKAGQGTIFRLELPAKLDYADLLFLRCGDWTYAVRQAVVSRSDLALPTSIFPPEAPALRTIQWGEQIAAAILLPRALGLPEDPNGDEWPTIEVQTSAGPIYIATSRIGETNPNHIRTLDALLSVPPWIGATTAGDGKLVFLLDPSALWEALRNGQLPPPPPDEVPAPIRRRALVVDDAVSVRRALADMLAAFGWEVDLCPNGEMAWEAFKRQGTYDVVLTDLEMNRGNGYELLGRIRARDPKIPVFVITSRAGQRHQEEARRLGATSYLVKPVDRTALHTALQYYCPAVYPHT